MNPAHLLRRITIEPAVMFGKPVIKGTRMPVDLLVEKVAFGASIQELLDDYPIYFAAHTQFGGSIRCSTHPLVRKLDDGKNSEK